MLPAMTAARKLEPIEENDPVLAAFRNAPLSDEPETAEERDADMAALADIRAGRTVRHEDVLKTLDRMRREGGE